MEMERKNSNSELSETSRQKGNRIKDMHEDNK